ncbi:hypothetical protein PHLH5_43090 [Pseudomonas sp. Cab53]|nr:hypothetical protein PHLH5_43090 [Pseudomonas sp. Cab53]
MRLVTIAEGFDAASTRAMFNVGQHDNAQVAGNFTDHAPGGRNQDAGRIAAALRVG